MKIAQRRNVAFFIATLLILGGAYVNALPYDYSAAIDCLVDPLKPQYNGGIIVNPEINDGLNGWTTHGGAKIEATASKSGNTYVLAHSRMHPNDTVSQKVFLEENLLYTFSAWIQVSRKRNVGVTAIFKTSEGNKYAGSAIAHAGCWSMLKGGLSVASSGVAYLYFQANDTTLDIWIDSVSLQPFTDEEWRSHQHQSIEKVRKANIRIQVLDQKGRAMPYANISINQKRSNFPIGGSITKEILNNIAYQNWFTKRFTVTTFGNEMKWYSTEYTRGKEDYSAADSMLDFASKHGIQVRGHNIFWDDPKYQPSWVYSLSNDQLFAATDKRLNSIVNRYKGKVISWDVNNENLHFNYYESKLGYKATNFFFLKTRRNDWRTRLYMNEYNTIEDEADSATSPSKYVQKIQELQRFCGRGARVGIGLEGHFHTVNLPYVRSALDILAKTNLPIWITELDVQAGPNQASDFEKVMREVYAHPAVQGIVIWGGWSPNGQCYQMCLVDPNFNNLPPGDVLDKLLAEWKYTNGYVGTTDSNGFINASLFHGDYELNLLQDLAILDNEDSPSLVSRGFKVHDISPKDVVKVIL